MAKRKFTEIVSRRTGREEPSFELDGHSLDTAGAVALGCPNSKITISESAIENMTRGGAVVQEIVDQGEIRYGITTGFGKNSDKVIGPDDIAKLQRRLIVSHSAGLGDPLSPEVARTITALRINTLLRGNSGIRPETVQRMTEIFNTGISPYIPKFGTVGASGDLAPLAQIALGFFLGEGQLWNPKTKEFEAADEVLTSHGFDHPYTFAAKEGLSLINGTQYITGMGSYATERTKNLYQVANVVTALSVIAFKGHREHFRPEISDARPHPGQKEVSKVIFELLSPGILEVTDNPQDPYSYRCTPQVHGVAMQAIERVQADLDIEINSSTDNPLVVLESGEIISGGNFHGQYPATALDYLTLGAIKNLLTISLQRMKRLNDGERGLPRFLASNAGLDSGFMAFEIGTTDLNRPMFAASARNAPTGAGQEDHVSLGPQAARQALELSERLELALTVELMCAVQGIRLRQEAGEDIKIPTKLRAVFDAVDKAFPHMTEDRYIGVGKDLTRVKDLIEEGVLFQQAHAAALGEGQGRGR